MAISGIEAFLEVLHQFGVRKIFGNPGTTELPLNDRLVVDKRFHYVLGLHETPVMAMADGYAMASKSLAVVNLHISCGLGNAMGMLYNAHREGTPLLVTAGQQDRRLAWEEPILGGDMVSVARPWTKWAYEVTRAVDVPIAVKRAAQLALTPPTGPVFLSLPVDVQTELTEHADLTPIAFPDARLAPSPSSIDKAVELLIAAERPAILAGSRVLERDAIKELVNVAELLGAPVIAESGTTHGRLPFPCDHPLYAPGLPLWSPEVRERLQAFDLLLIVGMDLLRQYVFFEPARPLPEHLKLVHLDESAWQLNKNYAIDAPVLGDIQVALGAIGKRLMQTMSAAMHAAAQARSAKFAANHQAQRQELEAKIAADKETRPMTSWAAMGAVASAIRPGTAVVEEAVTTTNTVLERLGAISPPDGYFGHRGWALGWGLGVAIGAKLAWPDRPVLALLGDGAAAYGIQGLWTAAKEKLPVVFVIFHNAQYQILKIGAMGMNLPNAGAGQFHGLDLTGPVVDYLRIAEGFGVRSMRAESPEQLSAAISSGLQGEAPLLIEAPITRRVANRLEYG
jgi:benzoylformate decarboxylase